VSNVEYESQQPEKGHPPTGKWATFQLASETFALRVADVQEVLMPQPLTPVPLAPDYIVGLLNLRGQVMPAIDLRRRLRFAPREGERAGSLLVIRLQDHLVSLVVDEIGDVLELPGDDWRAPPETLAEQHRDFVFGICAHESDGHHLVLGLRVESLSGEADASAGGR